MYSYLLLFLLASLFCIFFLSALSSTLVQSSASLLLYFNFSSKSSIAVLAPKSDIHTDRFSRGKNDSVRHDVPSCIKRSEMSEISVILCQEVIPPLLLAEGLDGRHLLIL